MAEQRTGEDMQRAAPGARRERLADALRENLRRRKRQARARRAASEDSPPLPQPASESPEH